MPAKFGSILEAFGSDWQRMKAKNRVTESHDYVSKNSGLEDIRVSGRRSEKVPVTAS